MSHTKGYAKSEVTKMFMLMQLLPNLIKTNSLFLSRFVDDSLLQSTVHCLFMIVMSLILKLSLSIRFSLGFRGKPLFPFFSAILSLI